MLKQLDIFSFEDNNTVESIQDEGSDSLYTKWRIYEYLESLKGETALVSYHDETIDFHIPFLFGDLYFESLNSRQPNQINIQSFVSSYTSMSIGGYKTITKVERNDGIHLLLYQTKMKKEKKTAIIEQYSKMTFKLEPYAISRIPNKQPIFAENQPLKQLIGLTATVKMRCNNDLIREITSIPFIIRNIKINEGNIELLGTNDVHIRAMGFKGVRTSSDLIFDIFTEQHGYSQTFHLSIN